MPIDINRFKLVLFLFFLSFLFVLFTPKLAGANGFVMMPKGLDSWGVADELGQHALINYDDGLQKMIIGIQMGSVDDDAYWVFPVPADPNEINIDILNDIPQIEGRDIKVQSEEAVDDAMFNSLTTQIYTTPIVFIRGGIGSKIAVNTIGMSVDGGIEDKVDIHKRLVKDGITTEVVSAESPRAIENYLKAKGHRNVDLAFAEPFGDYIGEDYSFVVSWITKDFQPKKLNNAEKKISQSRGVYVDFPTQKIYFPMILTRVYGERVVPASLLVIGYVNPEIYSEITPFTDVKYYTASSVNPKFDKSFYDGPVEELEYTEINVEAPSKYLVDDIWMKNSPPLNVRVSRLIVNNEFVFGLIYLAFVSIFTGLIVGFLTFSHLRKKPTKLALLGLSNIFSIIMLIVVVGFTRTKKHNPDALSTIQYLKNKGYYWKRKVLLVLEILVFPFCIFSFSALINIFNPKSFGINITILLLTGLIIYGIKRLKKIDPEDQRVFDQLGVLKYSSFTFNPKDDMKILFVIGYTICFVIFAFTFSVFLKGVL